MIDLRSDTLSFPSAEMLQCALTAPLGDAGRIDESGRGGDPTVNHLEDYAAALFGKERAMLTPSGTMGNHCALLTWCKPGDKVLVDTRQHLYRTEKAAFSPQFGQLQPVFYHLDENGLPDLEEIEKLIQQESPALLCLENTHNNMGGTCLPMETLARLHMLAKQNHIPIHMDGARLFNAAQMLHVEPTEICRYADSVMVCASKGLGAPMGSLVCGSREFILSAQSTRKLLGGNLRQAGVIAAMMEYALRHNPALLAEDHRRTQQLWQLLEPLKNLQRPAHVQTNMIMLETFPTGCNADDVIALAKKLGLFLSKASDFCVRIVLYQGISDSDVRQAAEILLSLDRSLSAQNLSQ